MKLSGKVAIVTGGGRDIGRAVCIKLAKEGAKVVINYFGSENSAAETLNQIKAIGGEGITVCSDVTKKKDIDYLIQRSIASFGEKIDILVNVAGGLFGRKTIEEMDEAYFDLLINVNFKSVFLVTKAVKPYMGQGGAIVNFSSQAARDGGGAGASIYAAAKGAVTTYTRALAKEFGPQGIRVNAVCPGLIATKFHDDFTKDQVRQNVANATPLRREGQAEEVADLVCYLVSDEASFLTGNNIDINGGLGFS